MKKKTQNGSLTKHPKTRQTLNLSCCKLKSGRVTPSRIGKHDYQKGKASLPLLSLPDVRLHEIMILGHYITGNESYNIPLHFPKDWEWNVKSEIKIFKIFHFWLKILSLIQVSFQANSTFVSNTFLLWQHDTFNYKI